MAIGFIAPAISAVSSAAKGLFSGAAKEARQERKEAKKEVKEAAKKAKEISKSAITGGANVGMKAGDLFAKVKIWVTQNWHIVAIIGAALAILFVMFRHGKSGAPRRRRSTGRGSSTMKARMARVRAARRRKRK